MKHKIEKNTVQETLIIPLFARKVCKTGTDNTRENQAKFSDFQSRLRPKLYRLCAGLRLCDKRRKGLRSGFLATAGHLVRYESH